MIAAEENEQLAFCIIDDRRKSPRRRLSAEFLGGLFARDLLAPFCFQLLGVDQTALEQFARSSARTFFCAATASIAMLYSFPEALSWASDSEIGIHLPWSLIRVRAAPNSEC